MIDVSHLCYVLTVRVHKEGGSVRMSVKGYSFETVQAILKEFSFRPWLVATISGGTLSVQNVDMKKLNGNQ